MKIRISELSASEKARSKVNVVNAHGLDFYNKCVAEDAPVIGTIDVTSTKEGPEFWINVLTEGEPTSENLIELTQRTLQVMESLIGGSSRSTEQTDDLVVGKWYGVTDGTSTDVISIFKYNGLGGGRTGWDTEGNWSTSIGDAFDEYARPVPNDILVLAFEAEARNRGYKAGVKTHYGVIRPANDSDCKSEFHQNEDLSEDHFFYNNIKVYKNGDWNNSPIVIVPCSSVTDEEERMMRSLNNLIERLTSQN